MAIIRLNALVSVDIFVAISSLQSFPNIAYVQMVSPYGVWVVNSSSSQTVFCCKYSSHWNRKHLAAATLHLFKAPIVHITVCIYIRERRHNKRTSSQYNKYILPLHKSKLIVSTVGTSRKKKRLQQKRRFCAFFIFQSVIFSANCGSSSILSTFAAAVIEHRISPWSIR